VKKLYLATSALVVALGLAGASPALSQSAPANSTDDLLEPLVRNDDDLLAPLVSDDDDLLTPLTPNDDDLLVDLVKAKQERDRERRWVEEQNRRLEREKQEKARKKRQQYDKDAAKGTTLVRTKHVDPCGSFEVSWGGRKTCHATERYTYELVQNGGDPPPPPPPEPEEQEEPNTGPSPSGASGGRAPGGSRGPRGGGEQGAGGGAPGPAPSSGAGPGPAPGSGPRPGPGPGPRPAPRQEPAGAPRSSSGGVIAPSQDRPTGWVAQPLRDFSARLDSAAIDSAGRADVVVTLRNISRVTRRVDNGDWNAIVADLDGVGGADNGIWTPTAGPPKAFSRMPEVPPGGATRVRFIIRPETVGIGLATVSINQSGSPAAVFDISAVPGARAPSPPAAPPTSKAAFARLKAVEVRLDQAATAADGRFELFFTARNHSQALQYLGGSLLAFSGVTPDGQVARSRGETYSIRGARGHANTLAPIQAGATIRLRVMFDARLVKGPFTVSDGTVSQILPQPPRPPAVEPQW
jgi:hypothetical protein